MRFDNLSTYQAALETEERDTGEIASREDDSSASCVSNLLIDQITPGVELVLDVGASCAARSGKPVVEQCL